MLYCHVYYSNKVVFYCRARRTQQRKKRETKTKAVDPDAHLSAKQRRKIKSKAIITSSDEDSDSDADKLKISEDNERYGRLFTLVFNVRACKHNMHDSIRRIELIALNATN